MLLSAIAALGITTESACVIQPLPELPCPCAEGYRCTDGACVPDANVDASVCVGGDAEPRDMCVQDAGVDASLCAGDAGRAELCNHLDDDCDGVCEVGLPGCRVAVHRSVGSSGPFYTTDEEEAACCGMTALELGYFHLYARRVDGTRALFRCLSPEGLRFYSTSEACDGAGVREGTVGFIGTDARCGATALYRLRHPTRSSLYTRSAMERDSAIDFGYTYVGITGYVWEQP